MPIAADGGYTALHLSAQEEHLVVTINLVAAGTPLAARCNAGLTPLHLAAVDHPEAMTALIEAGVDLDSCSEDGRTSLCVAAVSCQRTPSCEGNLDATLPGGVGVVPLDIAAHLGHSKVVRELMMQQVGTDRRLCGGATGGVQALHGAARNRHLDIMVLLMDAGVIDSREGLCRAVFCDCAVAVKFLLQRRQLEGTSTGFGYIRQSCRLDALDPWCCRRRKPGLPGCSQGGPTTSRRCSRRVIRRSCPDVCDG